MAMVCVLLMAAHFEARKSGQSGHSLGKNPEPFAQQGPLPSRGRKRLAINLVNLARESVNRLLGERERNA
jgi:hypothetical protein